MDLLGDLCENRVVGIGKELVSGLALLGGLVVGVDVTN